MIDIITGIVICHINIICHHKVNNITNYREENTIVCNFLKEVDDKPLPEWCYKKSTAQVPRHRNMF